MIVNDPATDFRGRTVDVTIHEITHNIFPFLVLSNETEHAWMDEAFASMLPYEYQQINAPKLSRILRFSKAMSEVGNTDWNIATMTNSTQLKGRVSYFNLYMKPGLALYFLQNILGKELFNTSLQYYIDKWKFKHPMPEDFFNAINTASNKNLNWYFNKWYYTNAYPDLKISSVIGKNITIEKIGELPVPINLLVNFKDGTSQTFKTTAAIWENNSLYKIVIESDKEIDNLKLGSDYIPDTDMSNNIYNAK